jgi:hypothetical protein
MIVPGDTAPEGLTDDEMAAWRRETALIIPVLAVAGVCPGDAVEVHADLVGQLEAQGWAKAPAPRAGSRRRRTDPDAPVEPEEATE